MWHFIQANIKAFWNGFVGGSVVCGTFFFADVSPHLATLGMYFLIILKAGGCGIITAFASAWAADFYKYRVQHRIFKNKKHGNQKESSQEDSQKSNVA